MHAVATKTIKNPIKAAFFLPSFSNDEPTIGEKINAETSKALYIVKSKPQTYIIIKATYIVDREGKYLSQ